MSDRMFLYVIGRPEGPVKVGITMDLSGRLRSIQTGCPFKVEILHSYAMRHRDHARLIEMAFHEVRSEQRLSGEWFDSTSERAIRTIEGCIQIDREWVEQGRYAA